MSIEKFQNIDTDELRAELAERERLSAETANQKVARLRSELEDRIKNSDYPDEVGTHHRIKDGVLYFDFYLYHDTDEYEDWMLDPILGEQRFSDDIIVAASYAGHDVKMEYAVDLETAEVILLKVDGRELK